MTQPTSLLIITTILVPILLATIFYHLDTFNPSPLPIHQIPYPLISTPLRNNNLKHADVIAYKEVLAPEDLVFDEDTGFIYTGCADGWIKRVSVVGDGIDAAVENVVNTGGRPLGLAKGHFGNWVVADTHKGLLNVTKDGAIEVLTTEAEGLPFGLTDAVDIGKDGIIYFTDATYKYGFKDHMLDILEGKPHGRFLSYNPLTKETKVLVRDLYFANGVVVSPDQTYAIYCETVMQRCTKYHLQGSKTGTVSKFIEGLPGGPDNIHYNSNGLYSIALSTGASFTWNILMKYPWLRKITAIFHKTTGLPDLAREAGAILVNKDGLPIAHYHDTKLSLSSSAITIGEHLYIGSVGYPYILRLNTTKYPAV